MTYSEKLKHPLWQKKRLEILERDKFTCQKCWDDQTELHIHHSYYKNGAEPWEYENDSLLSLCKHCHAIIEHFKEIAAKNTLVELIEVYKSEKGQKEGILIAFFRKPKSNRFILIFYKPLDRGVEPLLVLNDDQFQAVEYMVNRLVYDANNELCPVSEQ